MQTSLFDRDSGDAEDDDAPDRPTDGEAPEDLEDSVDTSDQAAALPRQTFAVGRLTARQAETELVTPGQSPLPGPWRVKAVIEDLRQEPAAPPESVDAGATRSGPRSSPLRRLSQLLERLGGGTVVDALRRLFHALLK